MGALWELLSGASTAVSFAASVLMATLLLIESGRTIVFVADDEMLEIGDRR